MGMDIRPQVVESSMRARLAAANQDAAQERAHRRELAKALTEALILVDEVLEEVRRIATVANRTGVQGGEVATELSALVNRYGA